MRLFNGVDSLKKIVIENLYFLIICLVSSPLVIYFGASISSTVLYILYIFLFNILPGIFLYYLLIRPKDVPFGITIIGWILGFSLEVAIYLFQDIILKWNFATTYLGLLYPFFMLIIFILYIVSQRDNIQYQTKNQNQKNSSTKIRKIYFDPRFLFVLIISLFLVCLNLFSRPLIDTHFIEQASIANSILKGYPYEYIDSVPLWYNYLVHVHIASASSFLNVATLDLSSRIIPFFLSIICLFSIYIFSIKNYQSKWISLLVIIQIFGVAGWQDIQAGVFASAIPSASIAVLSSVTAFSFFFLIISEYLDFSHENNISLGRLLLIIFLLWTISGLRFPGLFVFCFSLCFAIGFNQLSYLKKHRSFNPSKFLLRDVIIITFCVFVSVVSLHFFYGISSKFSATGFLKFTIDPSVGLSFTHSFIWLNEIGLPQYISAVISFILIVFGQSGFLLGGFLWLLFSKQIFKHPLDIFWLGTLFCGSLFIYFTDAGGGSQFTFMHYGHFGLNFLGARGIMLLLDELRNQGKPIYKNSKNLIFSILTILTMGILQFAETGLTALKKISELKLTQQKPVIVKEMDYPYLVKYLRENNKKLSCLYVSVAPSLDVSFWNHPLTAEIANLSFIGSTERLTSFLDRDFDQTLENHKLFLESLYGLEKLSFNKVRYLKNKFMIEDCLILIIDKTKINIDFTTNPIYEHGKFVVLKIE